MLNGFSRTPFAACGGLLIVGVLSSACSPAKPTPSSPPALALWGDMKPVVSVKELMRDMIDPASDYIFDAVKIETTKGGTVERVPKTEGLGENPNRCGHAGRGIYLLCPGPLLPATRTTHGP